jgi:ATP-dependent RNA helicase SUPV3L1/SUV3
VPVEETYAKPLYRIVGYKLAGTRAVRIDILERLADIIRPLIAWRPTAEQTEPPAGAINGYGFTATVSMTSLLGCSGEDFASVLRALGYRVERKPVPAKPAVPETAATPTVDATLAAEPPESAAAEAPAPEAAAPESTPAAETTPAEADAAAAAPAEAAAEPQFIEIWRPGRKERDQHPPRHHRRPQRQPKPAAAAPAENKPAAEANGTTTEQAQPQHHNKHRRHDRREDGERRDRRPRPEGRREQRDRDDRREDRSRREQRAEPVRFSTEAPRGDKRNRPADPNSPFAALAALKAELEAKERGG